MTTPDIRLFKIAYDEDSRASVRPPYHVLDNIHGAPDWYELWPMLQYLERTELEEDVWYGFLSPKFPGKAGLADADVLRVIRRNADCEVCLFSYDWPSLAYWQNPWVSGDRWHPGLLRCMEDFLASRGVRTDLTKVWTDFDTSVFSNYVVAKKRYWLEWRELARAYVDYVEAGGPSLPDNQPARHRGVEGYKLKTFVQERLACWILVSSTYRVARPRYALEGSLRTFLGEETSAVRFRLLLQGCHLSKKLARRTGLRVFERLFSRLHAIARRARSKRKTPRQHTTTLGENSHSSE